MAEGNPFMQLCSMLGGEREPGLTLIEGVVTQAKPLIIDAAELRLSGDELRLLTSGFSAGETVVLLTSEGQVFYVIGKVVSA